MSNVPMKFRDPRRKRSWVIIRKPFSFFQSLWPWPVTLTFDLVTSKSIGVIYQSWPMSLWSFMIQGVSVLELSSGNHFPISSQPFYCFRSTILLLQVTVTLTFDLVTWKSIGVICRSWPMYLWNFMIPGISVLELSSGNHFPISSNWDLDLWPWPLT